MIEIRKVFQTDLPPQADFEPSISEKESPLADCKELALCMVFERLPLPNVTAMPSDVNKYHQEHYYHLLTSTEHSETNKF